MPLQKGSKAFIMIMGIAFLLLSAGGAFAEDCVPSNGKSCYSYDELNRLKRVDYPDGSHILYEYDKLGNITSKVRQGASHGLTVQTTGSGYGKVTSSPAGISCGNGDTDCNEFYMQGTTVTLTATPHLTSTFAGWSGGGCSGTGTCVVTINSDITVTASFTGSLQIAKIGSGTVTSRPAGISCGTDCSEPYAVGTVVTLTATPSPGYTFPGWNNGGCSGTGTCVLTMTQSGALVLATFNPTTFNMTITKQGSGSGTVISNPTGISCGSNCVAPFAYGTAVTLTATPLSGSTFSGWSGGGCSGTGPCSLSMTADKAVTAAFAVPTTNYGEWHDALGEASGVDTCDGNVTAPYVCPTGVSKICNDVANYDWYYDGEDEYPFWNYRTVTCASGS